VIGGLAEIHRRGAKQADLVFVLKPRLTDAMLLRMVKRAHRNTKGRERLQPGPGIGCQAHMTELARGAAAARNDAGQAAHPLLVKVGETAVANDSQLSAKRGPCAYSALYGCAVFSVSRFAETNCKKASILSFASLCEAY
jgi:hypothetical protein